MYFDAVIAGFGGQGILLMGDLLAYAAMEEGKHVTYLPAYGVEMRGGTANCTVTIADAPIGSPVTVSPYAAAVMNEESFDKFQPRVKPAGLLFVNTSFVPQGKTVRTELDVVSIAANDLAAQLGNPKMANMVVLGAIVERAGVVDLETVKGSLAKVLPARNHKHIPLNIEAMDLGAESCRVEPSL
jgi:2-oxoglutarate ferredoxin oxidoreductase subunit gamma